MPPPVPAIDHMVTCPSVTKPFICGAPTLPIKAKKPYLLAVPDPSYDLAYRLKDTLQSVGISTFGPAGIRSYFDG
jgi:hypothetical protein